MPSTATPADRKRSSLPRSTDHTRQFAKDWDRRSRSGRSDMARLKQVMLLRIANDDPLGAEWSDHPLKGPWSDHRECHIGGDVLLIDRIDGGSIVFVRAGTHADLFE